MTNATVNATDDIVRTGSPSRWCRNGHSCTTTPAAVGNTLDITVTGPVSDLSRCQSRDHPGIGDDYQQYTDGGSFVYTASDGIETDTATVTVETDATPMAGDLSDEILVGTSAAEAIDGGGGNDILIGGGGADTLIGGSGRRPCLRGRCQLDHRWIKP